jgi:hypothetical protein
MERLAASPPDQVGRPPYRTPPCVAVTTKPRALQLFVVWIIWRYTYGRSRVGRALAFGYFFVRLQIPFCRPYYLAASSIRLSGWRVGGDFN